MVSIHVNLVYTLKVTKSLLILCVLLSCSLVLAQESCISLLLRNSIEYSVTDDFDFRDSLPETFDSVTRWNTQWGKWGPRAVTYPEPLIPSTYNRISWQRHRLSAVAKKYIGLAYKHRHIPSLGGLDCSNFTSWVYNYGLGLKFTSNIENQSTEVGRLLKSTEQFESGDLLFQWSKDKTRISHVVMWLENGYVIDSSKGGVQIRKWDGWRKKNFAWARRVIE